MSELPSTPDTLGVEPLFEPAHHEIAADMARFCAGELFDLPPAEGDEAARRQARQILATLGEAGWLGYAVPEEGRLDLRACCLVREALAAASPLADAVFALQCLGSQPLLLAGPSEAARPWLEAARAGRAMAAFAMTEEAAGSDVSAMETRAVRDGDGWRLDGSKRYISNAGLADFYVVFAVTDRRPERPLLSCFLVPADSPGLAFAGPQVMSEPHPLGEIELSACRLPAEALVGEEGEGFALGMKTLDRLRASVAAAACGMARRALDEALAHARSRIQFGRPLARFQLVQQKLAVMATELDAARLLTYRAALAADVGSDDLTRVSAMAKWYATETAQRVIDQSIQIHGGSGVMAASPVDRLYRAVRALRIYEGATEIQQLVVARELLRRDGAEG